jgi:hypothetical protein
MHAVKHILCKVWLKQWVWEQDQAIKQGHESVIGEYIKEWVEFIKDWKGDDRCAGAVGRRVVGVEDKAERWDTEAKVTVRRAETDWGHM